eukprot:g11889.t1
MAPEICHFCRKTISLVAAAQKCRCGEVFCDRHRDPDKHRCTFDYKTHQAAELRRANPMVFKTADRIHTQDAWTKAYFQHHAPRSTHAFFHVLGFCVFWYFVLVRGVLFNLLLARPFDELLPNPLTWGPLGASSGASKQGVNLNDPSTFEDLFRENSTASDAPTTSSTTTPPIVVLFRECVYAVVVGWVVAHVGSYVFEKYVEGKRQTTQPWYGGCRYGMWSWDVFAKPWFAITAEYEMLKDFVLYYVITQGKTNCLSYLYTAPDRSTGTIYKTVKHKVGELSASNRSG